MAIIPVAEEAATATGLLSWISRGIGVAAPLADLLFGRGHSEPARNNSIGPLAQWMQAPAAVMNDMFGKIAQFTEVTYATLAALKARGDRQFATATKYAATLYGWATARAHAETLNLAASVNIQLRGVRAYAANLTTAERTLAHAEVVNAGRSATILFGQAQAHAEELARADRVVAHAETLNLARSTNALISSTKVYADTVSTQAAARSTAKLSSDSALAVHPDFAGMRSDLEAAAAVFGIGQPAITALISRVPSAAPASLPGAEAAHAAITRVLTKTMEDCVAPNCRDTSKFGRDLQSLFGLVEGAAFLAFLAFIIRDPDAAVRETFDTLDGLTHTIIDGARNLVGV